LKLTSSPSEVSNSTGLFVLVFFSLARNDGILSPHSFSICNSPSVDIIGNITGDITLVNSDTCLIISKLFCSSEFLSLKSFRIARPKRIIAYLALGEAEHNLGSYDTAIESLKAAKAMNNNNADCHAFLGLSYMHKKDPEYELAVEEFRMQLKLEPNDRDGKQNLASACIEAGNQKMEAGKYREALQYYEETEKMLKEIVDSGNERDRKEIEDVLEKLKKVKIEVKKQLKN